MKRLVNFIAITSLVITLIAPVSVQASNKTLKDYKNELAVLKTKRDETNRLTQATINEINAKRNAINQANNEIEENENSVEESKAKVEESEEKIKETTEELYDTLNYLQTVDEQQAYVEFLINSNSLSDFIERSSIIDQITEYQNERINQLKVLIEDNYRLQDLLNNQNEILENSITEYEKKLIELNDYLSSVTSIGMDYNEQIKAQEELIKTYEEAGCTDNDSIDLCYYNRLASSSKFIRPLSSGKVTQAYGNYGHNGVDIGGNQPGTNVYASANGVVAYVSYRSSCGGNIVYIHHNVAGVAYTSSYAHLLSVNVQKGDIVDTSTVIGGVGGNSSTWSYDHCTTGTHLHYSIAFGHYLGADSSGYSSWSKFVSNSKATGDQSISGIKNVYGFSFKSRY